MQTPRPRIHATRSHALLFGLCASLVLCTYVGAGSARAEPRQLALLVGVGAYNQKVPDPWPPLSPHGDVVALSRLLIEKFGFRRQDVLPLEDKQASRLGIERAFNTHLIKQAQPGDTVVFYFAGHGQQLPDNPLGPDVELDGLDESLVPWDARSSSVKDGEKTNIRDDDLGRWLERLQARMTRDKRFQGNITVILDSCFSGSGTRGIQKTRGRAWNVSIDGARPVPREAALQEGRARPTKLSSASLLPSSPGYVVLAAAQSEQYALERLEGGGVFSWALLKALGAATPQTTYGELIDQIGVDVARQVRRQTPKLEGNPDARLFGGTALPARPYARVAPLGGNEIELKIGALHAVTVGSRYALHRGSGGPPSDQTLLTAAEVTRVEPLQSTAVLVKTAPVPSASELETARAVEMVHAYGDSALVVHFAGFDSSPELVRLAAALRSLDVVAPNGADAQHYQVELRVVQKDIELRRADSDQPYKIVPISDKSEEELAAALRSEWRWQYVANLTRDNEDVRVALRLVPLDIEQGADGKPLAVPRLQAAARHIAREEGQTVALELTNLTNRALYFSVLALRPDGEVNIVYPDVYCACDHLIKAGTTHELRGTAIRVDKPLGRWVLKVLATSTRACFGPLLGPQTPGAPNTLLKARRQLGDMDSGVRALAGMLANAHLGLRSFPSQTAQVQEYGTYDATIEVLPATSAASATSATSATSPTCAAGGQP